MRETKRLSLAGPAGGLEAQLTLPSPGATPAGTAVLCHPHPQYGGSMHDAVLATAESQFTQHNVAVLRFNFRGVGASEGEYDNGVGEAMDALAAINWLSEEFPGAACLLVGYSFGAAAAWRALATESKNAMTPASLKALWLIAPPVTLMAQPAHEPCVPVAIFHPDNDDYTSTQALREWMETLTGEPPSLSLVPAANHFFHGAQAALAAVLGQATA